MGETVTAGITALLAAINQIFTSFMGNLSSISTAIMDTPVLLFFVALPLIYVGIRVFRSLLNV